MDEFLLNIAGGEWIIIAFVALVLILGTNQLPNAAKKIGRIVNEYNKAKNDVQNQMQEISDSSIRVSGPVQDQRQKMETMAKSLGISAEGKTDDELKKLIADKIESNPDQEKK